MIQYLFTKTPLFFFIQSFWRDEAFSYLLAKKSIGEIIALTAKDFNPPLYYFCLHFWIKIFGHSEIALRSLSLIFFWATIYLVYLFLTDILKFSSKKSFFYLIFFIINPILSYYAFETRMYSMFAFFATLSFFSFYKKNQRLYLISTTLGLFTHYFMLFVVLTQIVFVLSFFKKGKDRLILLKNSLLTLFFFVPWTIFVVGQRGFHSEPFWIEKIDFQSLINLLGIVYTGYEKSFRFYDDSISRLSYVMIFLLILALFVRKRVNQRQKRLITYLLLWAVFPLALAFSISIFKPLLLPRYLIFSMIGFLILTVFVLEQIQIFPRILILIILFLITVHYQKLEIKNRRKADLRSKIREINLLAKKGDYLYVTSELDFHTAQYYFGEDRVFLYGKSYENIPNFVGKVIIPKAKVINVLPKYPQKAFILNENGTYDIQAMF